MVDRVGLGAVFARGRAPVFFALLVLGGALLLRHDVASPSQSHKSALNPLQVRAAFGHLAMSFEPNQGQSNQQVKFQARGNGYAFYLTKNEAVLAFPAHSKSNPDSINPGSLVEMQLVGGNPNAGISGVESLPGHSNSSSETIHPNGGATSRNLLVCNIVTFTPE
jgi:hypothetical protein